MAISLEMSDWTCCAEKEGCLFTWTGVVVMNVECDAPPDEINFLAAAVSTA